jgi:hypothetical protein
MKKLFIYIAVLIFGLFFITSCEKEKIGNTAVEKLAGEWYVTVVAVDAAGAVVYEDADLYGLGRFHLDTYNTSSNSASEMWINDNGNFWNFNAKMNVDLSTMTFQATDAQNIAYNSKLTITNGKVLFGATTTPNGMPADSIVFNVIFDDDTAPADYGFATYRVAGFRYTGFTNDN